jgi:hypothetical protein
VLGSNQRRLSRRFYSTLLLAEADAADQRGRASRLHSGPPPSAAPPPAPPGGQLRHQPQPPAAAVSDLDPDHAADGPDCDRDRLPFRARAAGPGAVPEQLPSSAASSPHGCPGPSTPAVNALQPAPAPPARPPSRSPGQPPWPPAHPPSPPAPRPGNRPGPRPDTRGCTPDSAARIKPETRRRRGPSVAVRGTADGAHRP